MRKETDRVRRYSSASVLSRIDAGTRANLAQYAVAGREQTDLRLRALEREWDTDRVVEAEGALTALTGIAAALLAHRRFFAMPAMAAAAIFLHATTGWHPLLPLFRRFGVRSAREIARERYALKVLRGDFDNLDRVAPPQGENRASTAAAQPRRSGVTAQNPNPELH